jgi:hypothetical protein
MDVRARARGWQRVFSKTKRRIAGWNALCLNAAGRSNKSVRYAVIGFGL